MRDTGYYWVKYKGKWMICHYSEEVSTWAFMYSEYTTNNDDHFEKIDETKIEMPI